ncbi:MAG: YjbF family lipoprotein [Pseudomonadota bacterium]
MIGRATGQSSWLRAGALLLFGALAGCSSKGDTTGERLGPLLQNTLLGGPIFSDPEPAPKPRVFTRAELNEIPFATVAVRDDKDNRVFVVPLADNGGYVVYQDAGRRGFAMRGGLIVSTQGLNYNLAAVRHAIEDPIATPTPVANWPKSVYRSYQFRLRSEKDFAITTSCSYGAGVPERIEIIELFFNTLRIEETCSNTVRSFQNVYWADPNTGFIWRSEQWVGPKNDPFKTEIIRPYSAG